MLLDQQLHDDAALIEAHLDTLTKDFDRDYPALFASMRYSLLAGGKRIRPFLTLQFCRLFGYDKKEVMSGDFTIVTPDSKNPYKQMYVAN